VREFVTQFCWAEDIIEISNNATISSNNGSCADISNGNVNWIEASNSIDSRRAAHNLPLWIALSGLLFLIPHYYWEWAAAGTLKGYISHIQFLIQIIKNKCETVPRNGLWTYSKSKTAAGIFDKNSETFNNTSKYKRYWRHDFTTDCSNAPNLSELRPPPTIPRATSTVGTSRADSELTSSVTTANRTIKQNEPVKGFLDRHLFSLLCHRNFAHLPEMTFIESIQRIATHGHIKTTPYSMKNAKGETINQRLTEFEKTVMEGGGKEAGALWCCVKLFTCKQNFTGTKLCTIYIIRLIITLILTVIWFVIIAIKGYFHFIFFGTNEKLCCSFYAKLESAEGKRDFQCFLPTVGDISKLVFGWSVILLAIFVANLYQLIYLKYEMTCFGFLGHDIESMNLNFIEKFIDNPLSYCPLWDKNQQDYDKKMDKATISEEDKNK